ncbi:MAG: patatin-like phospholipase family protein [Bacillota bacterium]
MGKYKILCFDGGGIRGILAAKLLDMLSKAVPGMLKNVRLYAGTSTGSIIALALAYGAKPEIVVRLYVDNGPDIFTPFDVPFYEKFVRGINKPKYNNIKLRKILEKNFAGSPVLGSLRGRVLVNAFKLKDGGNWKPVMMTNFPNSAYLNTPVVDAALRSSAAPVYFPSYQGFIDGGVFANNPCINALSAALDKRSGKAWLHQIRMLSFGTGFYPACLHHRDVVWGAMEWLDPFSKPSAPLLSILMDGSQIVDDYQCRMILGEKYCRVNIQLDKRVDLDDCRGVDYLVKSAAEFPAKKPEEWNYIVGWVKRNFV